MNNNDKISPWNDEVFIAEIERRTEEFESGKDKGYTWEEVREMARRSLKDKLKNESEWQTS